LIYWQALDSLTYINYYACAPESVALNFNPSQEGDKARAVLVPGTVAGLYYALQKYGTLSWTELLTRVIQQLNSGYEVDENLNRSILDSYEKLLQYPQTRSLYLTNDLPPEPGTIINNKPLLWTLSQLAEHGPDLFYRGAIADSLESVMIKYGGTLRKSDLEKYQVREMSPLKGSYRGLEIVTAPPPQSGMTLIEALNILEFQDLKAMGDYTVNSNTFHFMAEALRRVYTDRTRYLGDPRFENVPVDLIISKEFARSRMETIDMQKVQPFNPDAIEIKIDSSLQKKSKAPEGSTTHISIIDSQGNAVSLTQTLNHFWGSGITVCGFLLNNGMTSFSGESDETPNIILPGKQPRTTIAPTMLFENENLFMVIGSPGAGRIISTMVQVICSVVDFNMDVDAANLAPRFYSRGWNAKMPVEDRFARSLLAALELKGYSFQTMGDMDNFFGGVQLIVVDQEKQELIGSSDPRRSGMAAGF
jgi:gamma-glutamyltranspeptidase/glutathione hydrolase